MRVFVRFFTAVSRWLEKRFPEKMTTAEVLARFVEYENRLALLERNNEVPRLREEIAKIKIMNGLQQITGVGYEQ